MNSFKFKALFIKNKFNILIAFIAVVIISTPILFTQNALNDLFDFSETGQIGDTIGGITSPFINLLAAWLIYKSFMAQVKANKEVQTQIRNNRLEFEEDLKRRNFDSALTMYNMLFDDIKSFNVTSTKQNGVDNFKSFLDRLCHIKDNDTDNFFIAYEYEFRLFSGIKNSFNVLCNEIVESKYNNLELRILNIRITYLYDYIFNQIISKIITELEPNQHKGFSNELISIKNTYQKMITYSR